MVINIKIRPEDHTVTHPEHQNKWWLSDHKLMFCSRVLPEHPTGMLEV